MLHRFLYKQLAGFLKKHDRRKIAAKILMANSFNYSIKNANFVNSRSILFLCDIHPDDPISSHENTSYLDSIAKRLNSCITSGQTTPSIYVPSDGLIYFANKVLPKIDSPFILVSGDSDLPINYSSLDSSLDLILRNSNMIKWFAQNKDIDAPNIFSLPIGINIHNLWADPLQWGGGFILPALQELQLKTISENAQPLDQRKKQVFCNWHFSIDRADRRFCLDVIDKTICHFQPQPTPMVETWEQQSKFQFVLSPHGAGLDCHRTWEALLLGCIPIIKRSKINDLFQNLPVIEIDDWREINSSFLNESMGKLKEKEIYPEKLLMRYWKSQIRR